MGKGYRGVTSHVQRGQARTCDDYGLQARLDVLGDYQRGSINGEQRMKLLALIDSGQMVKGYGDRGEDLTTRLRDVSRDIHVRGRKRK